jgi:hypothetical protein
MALTSPMQATLEDVVEGLAGANVASRRHARASARFLGIGAGIADVGSASVRPVESMKVSRETARMTRSQGAGDLDDLRPGRALHGHREVGIQRLGHGRPPSTRRIVGSPDRGADGCRV